MATTIEVTEAKLIKLFRSIFFTVSFNVLESSEKKRFSRLILVLFAKVGLLYQN